MVYLKITYYEVDYFSVTIAVIIFTVIIIIIIIKSSPYSSQSSSSSSSSLQSLPSSNHYHHNHHRHDNHHSMYSIAPCRNPDTAANSFMVLQNSSVHHPFQKMRFYFKVWWFRFICYNYIAIFILNSLSY